MCSASNVEEKPPLNLKSVRLLIRLVKEHELLWKPGRLPRKEQHTKKCLWKLIGRALPRIGGEAEIVFSRCVQIFARELKNERESMSNSDAGAKYRSVWPFYKDLEFLRNSIKNRTTIPNVPRNHHQGPSSSGRPTTTLLSSNPNTGNSDIKRRNISGCEADSTIVVNRPASSPGSSVLKVKYNTVPTASGPSVHRPALNNQDSKYLEPAAEHRTQARRLDPPYVDISAALETVPPEHKMACIIKVLQVIAKYTKK